MTTLAADFKYESITFQSPLVDELIELRDAVALFEVQEDIRYPFTRAYMTLTDDQGFVAGVNITGGETISVVLKRISGTDGEESELISKKYFISKIKAVSKLTETSEGYIFELYEDVLYESNLQNLNRAYTGNCSTIINKIAANYLDKEINTTDNAKQSIKYIVPNLTPLEAMSQIAKRATTEDGYPFYLYSSLVDTKLNFVDLGSMIEEPVINPNKPFVYSSAIAKHDVGQALQDFQRKIIKLFEHRDTDDLFTLINKGLIGSSYQFIDTTKDKLNKFQFDVFKELLDPIVKKGVLDPQQNNVMYGPNFTFNDTPFNELSSRKITRIGGSSAFKSVAGEVFSLRETNTIAEYKHEVISRAMKDILIKAPLTIVVNGFDFISGEANLTIGRKIDVEFLSSDAGVHPLYGERRNKKLSGSYLIYGSNHMFNRDNETHQVKLSLVKLGNYV